MAKTRSTQFLFYDPHINNIMNRFWFYLIVLFLAIHLVSASTYEEATDDGVESTGDFTLTVPTLSENFPFFDDVLSFGHYQRSCPQLESIINKKVKEWIKKDYTVAASLLRLHFHDCAVRVRFTLIMPPNFMKNARRLK